MPIFMDRVQLPKRYRANTRRQFTFYHLLASASDHVFLMTISFYRSFGFLKTYALALWKEKNFSVNVMVTQPLNLWNISVWWQHSNKSESVHVRPIQLK